MPVEIRELVIRAVVDAPSQQSPPGPALPAAAEAERQALIEECVRQVLKVLKRDTER